MLKSPLVGKTANQIHKELVFQSVRSSISTLEHAKEASTQNHRPFELKDSWLEDLPAIQVRPTKQTVEAKEALELKVRRDRYAS